MSTLAEKLKHELRELIPITLFFFAAFQLLALTEALILKEYGIRASVFLAATVAALVAAKVVAISDHVPAVNQFRDKPRIYNILSTTLIYFGLWLVVRYAEHVIRFWRETGAFAAANRRLFEEMVWPHFWSVQLWMFILLLVFCTFRELARTLGRSRLIQIFFHPPARPTNEV